MLTPVILPVALRVTAEITLAPVMLPCAPVVVNPPAVTLPVVMMSVETVPLDNNASTLASP